MANKKFRLDLLTLVMITSLLLWGFLFIAPGINTKRYILAAFFLNISLLIESVFIAGSQTKKTNDSGFLSLTLFSFVIITTAYYRYLNLPLLFALNIWNNIFVIGIILIIVASAIRIVSKIYLKEYFSYNIMTAQNQKLITTGPYSIIRHPGYFGTILAILGATFMYAAPITPLFIILSLPVTVKK
ncbi:MAG: DUF1295 domain-containing protein [Spirochaetes bacterium]|nr:DUF1295 domain-containing protein [Spirochaetota bacterium]